jgi:predicted site-specific integrase-resolvase
MSEKKWLSRKDICQALAGISMSTLYRRIKDGTISSAYIVKIGNRVAFSNEIVNDLSKIFDKNYLQEEINNERKTW